jgi:hypothetical protein
MTAEVLTRARGLIDNISPTGVKYIVEDCKHNPAIKQIRSTNKTGPEVLELSGHWTSNSKAQTALTRYLIKFWDMSDEQMTKNLKTKAVA